MEDRYSKDQSRVKSTEIDRPIDGAFNRRARNLSIRGSYTSLHASRHRLRISIGYEERRKTIFGGRSREMIS